jgi:transcriptional regulator GlxA family with amidase domain
VLAEAGLLDGRRATTHWHRARELQARFPKVKVEEDRIFIIDGPVWTSAGMTAGIDLALAMIEQDLGADVARAVARQLVVYHRRAGGQSQFSALNGRFASILFSNSGSGCQALHDRPCRAHCSLRGRGEPSA